MRNVLVWSDNFEVDHNQNTQSIYMRIRNLEKIENQYLSPKNRLTLIVITEHVSCHFLVHSFQKAE